MKKVLNAILTAAMVFSLAACSSAPEDSGNNTADETETEVPVTQTDPLEQYIGKYLQVEMKGEEGDYTEFLASSWEDRSFYQYIDITEDSELILYTVDGGEKTETEHYGFDAETHSVVLSDNTKEEIAFEGDAIILNANGYRMVFEKTDEIPD